MIDLTYTQQPWVADYDTVCVYLREEFDRGVDRCVSFALNLPDHAHYEVPCPVSNYFLAAFAAALTGRDTSPGPLEEVAAEGVRLYGGDTLLREVTSTTLRSKSRAAP